MSTIKVDTVRPVTADASLTIQGDSGGSGVTGLTIDSSGNASLGGVLKLKSSGNSITASDGTSVVLSESSSVVTLTADEANFGSNALVVDASGNVGVGTSSPTSLGAGYTTLHLKNTSGDAGFLTESDGGIIIEIQASDAAGYSIFGTKSNHSIVFRTNDIQRMQIDSSGNIGAPSGTNIYNASDQRVKQNITDLSGCLQKVLLMRGVSFNWIDKFCDSEAEKTLYGLVAQELQIIDSNLVDSFSDNIITAGEVTVENPLRVNEKFIIPMLVESIKEQQALIESQQSQIDTLNARIVALETT